MSVVEEQAEKLGVDAAGGAKDGGQERDTMIVSVSMLILIGFLLGGFKGERDVYYWVGRRPEKTVKGEVKLREAKATRLRINSTLGKIWFIAATFRHFFISGIIWGASY